MFDIKHTLVASAIATMGLAFTAGVSAQPPAWLADEGPLEFIGDIVVDNTGKGGTAPEFGCKVKMQGVALGVNAGTGNTDFRIDSVQILNNGWNDNPGFSAFCHQVDTLGSLPWSGSIDPTMMTVTLTGLTFTAPNQPGCGVDDAGNPDPNSSLSGQWRQGWVQSHVGALRSTHSVIDLGDLTPPATPIVDADSDGNCLIGGVVNVTRPTGPLVEPTQ